MEFLGIKGGEIKTLLQKNNITLEQLKDAQVDANMDSMVEHLQYTGELAMDSYGEVWIWQSGSNKGDLLDLDSVEPSLLLDGTVVYEVDSDSAYWVMDIKDWVKHRGSK